MPVMKKTRIILWLPVLLLLGRSTVLSAQASFDFVPGRDNPEVTFDARLNGARIYNNGIYWGTSPLKRKTVPGTYALKVEIDGYKSAITKVQVLPTAPECTYVLNTPVADTKEVANTGKNRPQGKKLADGTEYSGSTTKASGNLVGLSKELKNYFSGKTIRTGTMREDGVGVAVFGNNDYVISGTLPGSMSEYLAKVKQDGLKIKDVLLTSKYNNVITQNDGWSGNYPRGCHEKMLEMRDKARLITVAFNDNGDYIILSEKEWYSSSSKYNKILEEAVSFYGKALHVHITNKGIVVTCDKGVYYNNVPEIVIERLANMNNRPVAVKFTDAGSCLMYDASGKYEYFL